VTISSPAVFGPEIKLETTLARSGYEPTATAAKHLSADEAMMARCIELSRIAVELGEYPFGTVIALEGRIASEAINRTIRDADMSRHAEIIALSEAQRTIDRERLRCATLYSNVEPCAMCAYCIREAGVSRVVYALGSPVMGGNSRWNILRDQGLADRIPEIFGAVPEVVSGVLAYEAERAWREWSPFAWRVIKWRGLLMAPRFERHQIQAQPGDSASLWRHLSLLFTRSRRLRPPPMAARKDDF
jgi:tRNA(adenine34) deaminase